MSDRTLHQVVKGSGKAADLLADIAIFTEANSSEDKDHKELNPKDQPQTALTNVLQMINDDAANFDILTVIKTLKKWEGGRDPETDLQRSIDVKLKKLICETYDIVEKGNDLHQYLQNTTTKKFYKYLRESLEAVNMGLVFVLDSKASSADRLDFNKDVLKCVHKSIDMSQHTRCELRCSSSGAMGSGGRFSRYSTSSHGPSCARDPHRRCASERRPACVYVCSPPM
jgi:hypothetical protein